MNPDNIPFNALIIAPTNSGKTRYLVNLMCTTFRGTFDLIVLLYQTFIHNKAFDGFTENEGGLLILTSLQGQINDWLKIISYVYEGTNTMMILDDCAASRGVKQRRNELMDLTFSARHKGISV